MKVRFKKSGRVVDSKAGEKFVEIGIAEEVKPPKKADSQTAKEPVKKKPAKRGRPKRKK